MIDTKGKLTFDIFCQHKTLNSFVLTFLFLFIPKLPTITKLFGQKHLIKKKYTAIIMFTVYLYWLKLISLVVYFSVNAYKYTNTK